MNKVLEFLSRYVRCLFDYTLYQKYFKEMIILAIVFIIPIYGIFGFQSYIAGIEPYKDIESTFDDFYDAIKDTTYSEIIDFNENDSTDSKWTFKPDDIINIEYLDGKLILEQEKVLKKTFKKDGLTYSIIIDTNNVYDIKYEPQNKYTDEEFEKMNFIGGGLAVYITDEFVLYCRGINTSKSVSHEFSITEKNYLSTKDIYLDLDNKFLSKNKAMMMIFSAIFGVMLFTLYFIVVYMTVNSTIKRRGFTLTKKRKILISIYAMPAGAYVYILSSYILKGSSLGLSLVVPVVSMLSMLFVTVKTLDSVKDFIKKEERVERKKARKKEKRNT